MRGSNLEAHTDHELGMYLQQANATLNRPELCGVCKCICARHKGVYEHVLQQDNTGARECKWLGIMGIMLTFCRPLMYLQNKRRHRRLCLPQSGAMPCVIVTVGPIGRSIYTALLVQSYTALLVQSWLK